MGFQNSASTLDLLLYAARSYSLMRPPRTGRRLIRSRAKSARGLVGPGRAELAAAVRSSSVIVPDVLGQDRPQVPFTEDQHPIGDLGPGGEHESLGVSIRARAPGRDLHCSDACAGQDRVEGFGELPCAIPDQEPEVLGVIAEVHQEIADLLSSPRSIRMSGDPQDVDVAGAHFDDEQAVQAPECHCAVHVEEVGGEDGRGLGVQELPPSRVGVPHWGWRNPQSLEYPTDGRGADPVAELEQLALDALVSPPWFSAASGSMSAVISALTGGRPVRFV